MKLLILFISLFIQASGICDQRVLPDLQLVFLGETNKLNEATILLTTFGSQDFISIDSGTTLCDEKYAEILRDNVKAHFISHANFNHFMENTSHILQDESKKNIYALEETIQHLRDHVFNWSLQPNYADEGTLPHIGYYHYVRLPLRRWIQIPRTKLQVTTFLAENKNNLPTGVFLFEYKETSLLYVGSGCKSFTSLCEEIAPLIREKKCLAFLFRLEEGMFAEKEVHQILKGIELFVKKLENDSKIKVIFAGIDGPLQLNLQSFQWIFLKPGDRLEI